MARLEWNLSCRQLLLTAALVLGSGCDASTCIRNSDCKQGYICSAGSCEVRASATEVEMDGSQMDSDGGSSDASMPDGSTGPVLEDPMQDAGTDAAGPVLLDAGEDAG